jgi:ABC-type sugar transport system ATPase subunit
MNFLTADLAHNAGAKAARGPGFEIPLGAATLRPASEAIDRVVVGIRPERLALVPPSGVDSPVSLGGQVAMREVLGAEVVLHLESPAGPLTLRADASSAPRPGDAVQVWLDPKSIHLFDAGSEARL